MYLTRTIALAALALFGLSGCATLLKSRTEGSLAAREFSTRVLLHGKWLALHVSPPSAPVADQVVVLYASGDGGWFGAAVDMFHQIGKAGYPAVGFSARELLKIERPRGGLVSAAELAAEYDQILAQARRVLALGSTSGAVLTGWSRGAAFSVLVGSEPSPRPPVVGVIAIGLAEGALLARLGPLPCAVIQATRDNYLPAPRARQLFGPDTPLRRFYAVDARNHRFSGGKAAFDAVFFDALRWVASRPVPSRDEARR